jgi:ubiquinone/menaquinone biosynthesis C-methylase UbiE
MKRYRAIAEYYDAEGERLHMLKEDVPFLLTHLPRRSQSVLELAVGTARAAIPIAQAGHRVVGVDYAPDMLAIARRKRDAVGLTEKELSLVQGDVLKLNLRRKFDRVVIVFNTFLGFTKLEQQDRVLQVVRKHLKPSGRFWIDVFNPDLSLLSHARSVDLDPSTFHVPRFDRTVFRTVDVRRDMARQWMEVTFNYKWFDQHGTERREKTVFEMTVIYPRELRLLLERNGLVIDELWGDYDGSALKADSPRMIASCRLS